MTTKNIDEAKVKEAQELADAASKIENTLTTLQSECTDWTTNEYAASNKKLYSILTKCYEIVFSARPTATGQERLKEALKLLGVGKVTTGKFDREVVKHVFKLADNRQRVSAYSKVLKLAYASKPQIKPADLASWIEGLGGVEEIRLQDTKGKSRTTVRDENIAKAKSVVKSTDVIGTMSIADNDKPADFSNVIAIGTFDNGTFNVSAFIESESVKSSALEWLGKQQKEVVKTAAEERAEAVTDALNNGAEVEGEAPAESDADGLKAAA
jgi:hypothetical protein